MSAPTWVPTAPPVAPTPSLMPASPTYAEMADWVVRTCLLFGSSVETAYTVAGMFVTQVKRDRGELRTRVR